MAKLNKGLGRGLDALLAGSASEKEDVLREVNIAVLKPGKYQPRSFMDADALESLASSIKSQGIMQPILVRTLVGGDYEIIAGERRWRAAKLAGLTQVPVLVRSVADNVALAMALIENIQRENLNPLEEAAGLQRLIDEFSMTHQTAAEAVGRSRSTASNLLRLLKLIEPVQTLLLENKLDMGHARALLGLEVEMQLAAAEQIVAEKLTVRASEQLVQRLLKNEAAPVKPEPNPDTERLQTALTEQLGASVTIKSTRKGAGKLVISYKNAEQLNALIARMK
ncbi:MAG: ParB/RepB/Spo0J family partition protein [Gallionella sp.]|nr:ParB/RepB/Spo0J family partition protein [Gallionella sp.]MDD4959001.1 ParB/RepB/Spo0J family partition protein [Gallionella sp.]